MSYVWPGLLKSVRPGDVFTVKEMDPTGSAGYSIATYLCVWCTHYTGEDDMPGVWIGGLRLGRFILDQLFYRADLPIEYPWTRDLV